MKVIAGVMGPGTGATPAECEDAYELGSLIAQEGWVTLSGGRRLGVMEAALQGARDAAGITVGVLPHDNVAGDVSQSVDIPILTGLGEARNIVNVLSSRVVFVCGMNAGTASEVALALKAGRLTILVNPSEASRQFWPTVASDCLYFVESPAAAIALAKQCLGAP